ncbi:MAG TPA: IS21 family transposase [Thermodesulfobacteriota bacterium]
MIEPEVVRQVRILAERGWGAKRIARALGVARNTVRRYLRGGPAAQVQTRPGRRRLDPAAQAEAVRLFETTAAGNAVVVTRLLADQGVWVSVRTVQRAVAERRRQQRAAALATVRFETAPGAQLQVDFGEQGVLIAGQRVRVYLLVTVLGYSRRLFVRRFLAERQDDWREGIAAAFRHFGGVPRTLLVDNARPLVLERDRVTGAVRFHPSFLAFCRDWDVEPRACAPYRARTKGKIESGIGYVKHNGLAGRTFDSLAALEAHLARWMAEADQRLHGTTHERPADRFTRAEQAALRPLPARPLPTRERRLVRRVAADALVDVDTVRYSVPHRLVRDRVEVVVGETTVRIYHGAALVAEHVRAREPHVRVTDPAHYAGLWRRPMPPALPEAGASPLAALGRQLADYAAVVEEAGR